MFSNKRNQPLRKAQPGVFMEDIILPDWMDAIEEDME